jgi:hypothetical protein
MRTVGFHEHGNLGEVPVDNESWSPLSQGLN